MPTAISRQAALCAPEPPCLRSEDPPGLLASNPVAGKILGMLATLSLHALVRNVAESLDVVMGDHRAGVVEPETGRRLISPKRRTISSGLMQRGRPVNARTLALGRSAPADLKKDANGFDLSIALGLLLASGQVAFDRPGNYAIVGELALTGETRPVKGILSMAIQFVAGGRDGLLVPTANATVAAVVEGLDVYPVGSFAEAVGFLSGFCALQNVR